MAELEPNARWRNLLALVFGLVFPTVLTVVYFILLAKHSPAMQQAAYAIGKTMQFTFPAVWVLLIQRQRVRLQAPLVKDVLFGAVLGAVLLATGLMLYELILKPAGVFDAPAVQVRNKVAGIGIHGFWPYVIMALFYCAMHSLLEEYYWRWFIFAQLRQQLPLAGAIGVSSLGFMAHHVCVLSIYFGWFTLWTTLFSAAVAGGGVIWAWQYQKSGSLYGVWIGHALVDAVIFIIGYDLIT
jgi:CAAX protease family protein